MVCAPLIFDKNETIEDLRGGIQFLHSNLANSAVPVVMMMMLLSHHSGIGSHHIGDIYPKTSFRTQ